MWTFRPDGRQACIVGFAIDYEFKSRVLSALMGSVFDRAFRKFSERLRGARRPRLRRLAGLSRVVEHGQRLADGGKADGRAPEIAEAADAVMGLAVAHRNGQMHQPDRLLRRAAVRPGDAGDGDGEIGLRAVRWRLRPWRAPPPR